MTGLTFKQLRYFDALACLRPVWGLFGACLGPVWGLFAACLEPFGSLQPRCKPRVISWPVLSLPIKDLRAMPGALHEAHGVGRFV